MDPRVGQAAESFRRPGRGGRGAGAWAPADAGQATAQVVGVGGRELGEAVADDPCAVAVVAGDRELRLATEGGRRRVPDRVWASDR